jgi:hypothetical protein
VVVERWSARVFSIEVAAARVVVVRDAGTYVEVKLNRGC